MMLKNYIRKLFENETNEDGFELVKIDNDSRSGADKDLGVGQNGSIVNKDGTTTTRNIRYQGRDQTFIQWRNVMISMLRLFNESLELLDVPLNDREALIEIISEEYNRLLGENSRSRRIRAQEVIRISSADGRTVSTLRNILENRNNNQ